MLRIFKESKIRKRRLRSPEFIAYHTWDHGGDSFDVSLYPKSDESIKFNAHVWNDGKIIDYYTEYHATY